MSQDHSNPFLIAPLGALFARTAAPIVFVMSMNGLLTVMDAVMLGLYAGPEAVAAVTAVFPIFMLLVALATLVGSGMASLLARRLGAGDLPELFHGPGVSVNAFERHSHIADLTAFELSLRERSGHKDAESDR